MNIGKKTNSYQGTRPNVPADLMLILCKRIWRRFHRG
jgi:hypothetical protein